MRPNNSFKPNPHPRGASLNAFGHIRIQSLPLRIDLIQALDPMRTFVTICLLSAWSFNGQACELPTDPSYFSSSMREERELTLQALAKSDSVVIGTVKDIRYGRETSDPGDRVSDVDVEINQALVGLVTTQQLVTLKARLHHVISSCFGNEAFWDDQVELGGEYIFFVAASQILSASPPARSWRRLGLAGQREIVLSASGR